MGHQHVHLYAKQQHVLKLQQHPNSEIVLQGRSRIQPCQSSELESKEENWQSQLLLLLILKIRPFTHEPGESKAPGHKGRQAGQLLFPFFVLSNQAVLGSSRWCCPWSATGPSAIYVSERSTRRSYLLRFLLTISRWQDKNWDSSLPHGLGGAIELQALLCSDLNDEELLEIAIPRPIGRDCLWQ